MHKNKDDNKGVAEIIVAKNRTGPVGTIRVAFVKETTRWATLARF
jgi:replicative DNA helicase